MSRRRLWTFSAGAVSTGAVEASRRKVWQLLPCSAGWWWPYTTRDIPRRLIIDLVLRYSQFGKPGTTRLKPAVQMFNERSKPLHAAISQRWGLTSAIALWWLDVFGNAVPVLSLLWFSCWNLNITTVERHRRNLKILKWIGNIYTPWNVIPVDNCSWWQSDQWKGTRQNLHVSRGNINSRLQYCQKFQRMPDWSYHIFISYSITSQLN